MNSKRRILSKSLSAGLGLSSLGALSLAGCMSPSRNPTEPIQDPGRISGLASRTGEPTLILGQGWEYQATNMFNGSPLGSVVHRIESVRGQAIDLALINPLGVKKEVFSERWKVLQESHHDATLRFENPAIFIPAQLNPGFEERQRTRYVVVPATTTSAVQEQNFRDLYWQTYLDVQGWETLQVPAGRFEVARIRRRVFFKHFDGFRSESTRTETIWYSPRLGYWVAREWSGQYLGVGSRRRGGLMREDWVRWELTRALGPPTA
jgi:hypothetical protein